MGAAEGAAEMTTANCERCGVLMRLAEKRNEKSMPFKLARIPKGLCANCVVTEFLYNTYPVNEILDRSGPQILLVPHMRNAFAPILQDCDMGVDEINWALIVQNWSLPVKTKRGARNPYSMGEYAERERAKQAQEKAQDEAEDALAKALGGDDPKRQGSIREQLRKQRPIIY
jgi:hypothetical protein